MKLNLTLVYTLYTFQNYIIIRFYMSAIKPHFRGFLVIIIKLKYPYDYIFISVKTPSFKNG